MTDRMTIRIVVATLGLLAIIALSGGIYLNAVGKDVNTFIVAMGTASIGAVAGILTKTSSDVTPADIQPQVHAAIQQWITDNNPTKAAA